MDGRGSVATDGRKVLQPILESGRCCNRWAEGVATNRRDGTGKMQLLFTVVTVKAATRSHVLYPAGLESQTAKYPE